MTFEEFLEFIQSENSKTERDELETYFSELKRQKRVLSFEEWSAQPNEKFLFLTYDLIDTDVYRNRYTPINNYLATLGFDRMIFGRNLTNNCFVAFPNPLDPTVMNAIGARLIAFFTRHLPDFRIYMNITSKPEFFLHP